MNTAGAPIRGFRDLVAWQKSVQIGLETYRLTASFPAEERFGLVNQVRRASVSIASNIAEGYGRGGRADYVRFLKLARGSLYELETQTVFAARLAFAPPEAAEQFTAQLHECSRILGGLIRSLKAPHRSPPSPQSPVPSPSSPLPSP